MLTGTCHCGALSWKYTADLQSVTACNCSICRRYGALWLYGWEPEMVTTAGPSAAYARGAEIDFHFCPTCGCLVFYRCRQADPQGRRKIGANLRMADSPAAVAHLSIDHFDGLDSFEDLPTDHRRVADMWF